MDECAARGVKVALVMTSGFGETADPDAQEKQRAMAERARAAGMRLIGPNTQGLANFGNGAVLNFSTMFIETEPKDGPVGMVSPERGHERGALRAAARPRVSGYAMPTLPATTRTSPSPSWPRSWRRIPDLRLLLLYLETIRDPWNLAEAGAHRPRRAGYPSLR